MIPQKQKPLHVFARHGRGVCSCVGLLGVILCLSYASKYCMILLYVYFLNCPPMVCDVTAPLNDRWVVFCFDKIIAINIDFEIWP